jgi:purine-binding chemotaxis protein CheW
MNSSAPSPAKDGVVRHFLTFRVSNRRYALPAEDIAEVIRLPAVAKVPQAPKGLLGIANLRGSILPVASMRSLLGQPDGVSSVQVRAIVMEGAAPVALCVDGVDELLKIAADRIETRQAELAAHPGELLNGAFPLGVDGQFVKILDIKSLLATVFVPREKSHGQRGRNAGGDTQLSQPGEPANQTKLVTFEVAGQEYALPLDSVQEIVTAPDTVTALPNAETLVLGVACYRDSLLPLLSLRGLLGFPIATERTDRQKVVVALMGGDLVGLVVDRMRAIFAADERQMEEIPEVLAARAGGESKISAIYRGGELRGLVSVLAPEQLFGEDVMLKLGAAREPVHSLVQEKSAGGELRQFLVFRLGEEEFGLPIEAVEEVARVPDQIAKVPKTPKFLEGVINLRGEVLPVVDQRRRFNMPKLADGAVRRLIVVRTQRHRAGLIVDSVSEVLRSSQDAIAPAPDLAGETAQLVHGVINLESVGRMVLVLDPAELLSRAEQGLLDAFDKRQSAAEPPAG